MELSSDIDLKIVNSSDLENGGVIITHHLDDGSGRSIENRAHCSGLIPEGHFRFDPSARFNGSTLQVETVSQSLCEREIENPFVDDGNCTYQYNDSTYSYQIILSNLNKDQYGWVKTVTATGTQNGTRTVIYQPCGTTLCPDIAFCDGDEFAYLWVCADIQDTVDEKYCLAYGLAEYPIDVYLYDEGVNVTGITVEYHGDDQRIGKINVICDHSVSHGQLEISESIEYIGNIVRFNALSNDTCPFDVIPVPTPYPTFQPVIPTVFPSYSPNPSPYPIVYAENDTHYIVFDLSRTNEAKQVHTVSLVSRGAKIPFLL